MAIPCYVSGKGMYATDKTRQFKVTVIERLEAAGVGYDTRYRYYQQQFPSMLPAVVKAFLHIFFFSVSFPYQSSFTEDALVLLKCLLVLA